MKVNTKLRTENMRNYLLKDVASCTFTFIDGVKSKVTPSPDNDIILLKLISRTSKLSHFEDKVLSNYSRARNMNELAKLCNYDCLRTFIRYFKKCFGQTPYQWMLERKMEEIQFLVLNSDISITEISKMYKFKSVSHLVNAYGKRFGISPYKSRLSNVI